MHIDRSLHRPSGDETAKAETTSAGSAFVRAESMPCIVRDLLSVLGLGFAVGLSVAVALALTHITQL